MCEMQFRANRAEDLDSLAPLIGRWRVTGGAVGSVTYEWMPGGHFLLQKVELEQDGHRIRGLEVIGHLKPFGQEPDPQIRSRFYDNDGNTLDYVYQLDGGQLTIWAGEEGSPVVFRATLDVQQGTMEGMWDYAGQGGYSCTMKRIDHREDPS